MVMTSSALHSEDSNTKNHEEEQKRLDKFEQERITMSTTSSGLYKTEPDPLPTPKAAPADVWTETERPQRKEVAVEVPGPDPASEIEILTKQNKLLQAQHHFLAGELRQRIDKFVGLKMVHGEVPAEMVGQLVAADIEKINQGLQQIEREHE